jgi:hypothetical protein
MAKKTVADLLVDTLAAAGIERVYGVAADSRLWRGRCPCGLRYGRGHILVGALH